MSRRGSPGASLLGALFIVGFVGWVLSQIWVYLVVGGAVALMAWIGWVVSRNLKLTSAASAPRLVTVDAPRAAPPPEEKFRVVSPVDPTVFDDSVLAEAAALKVFGAWTRPLPMAPTSLSDVVRSLELRVRHIGRLVSDVAQRQVVWREASYGGSAPPTGPRLAAESVDAWSMSPEALRSASQYVSSCGRCASDGKTACESCGGTTKVKCTTCDGAGKAYGYAANGAHRLLNCKSCKGKGELKCTVCTKGKVTCPICHGAGRVERWLEISETVRTDIQIEPDGQMTVAFPWGTDGTSASRADVEADAKIVFETSANGPIPTAQIASAVPSGWMEANSTKIEPKLKPGEQIRSQTFWLLEVPSIELSYALGNKSPTVISFEGRRMLAPPSSVDRQFAARAQRVRLVRYAVAGISVAVPIAYLLRGSYYWNGWLAGLALSLSGLAVAVDGFFRYSTLGKPSARTWAMGAAVAALFGCTFAIGAEPSARAARRYISAGDLDRARIELAAIGRTSDRSTAQAWAELHLAEAQATNDIAAATREAAQIPDGFSERTAANAHVLSLAKQSVEQALSQKQPARAASVLEQSESALQRSNANVSAQVAELRARIHDEEFTLCSTDACRWKAAFLAQRSTSSPVRAQHVADSRARLVDALASRPPADADVGPRLKQLDNLLSVTGSIADVDGDAVIATKAHETAAWAASQRASIPIIGSERTVAADLLGLLTDSEGSTISTQSGDVAVYCSMRGGHCAGIYLVGKESGSRALNDGAHSSSTEKVLSQCLGHNVPIPDPPKSADDSSSLTKWRDRGVTIAARWRGTDLMELRIGDAQP